MGTFNQLTAQSDVTSCQPCPDGYISLETRAGCRPCPGGFWCDPQRGWQGACVPGQYSPEGEMDCQECPKGYVCPNGREKERCLEGHEPDASHTSCVPCFPGFFSTEGSSECQPCLAGHYCPNFGTAQPIPCPPGSWR
ncbi:PREDICTED: signal peptide, CUB and EGF-like domain-containing protein 1 [Thamnophis sirtalis]|uniref:Signal peptide, CUB and EGF-like domain-containing protein 1 n=1 Tax=Thamnophis sirtalis TaxID=35019 RepID=A0A6I9XPU5_9SAUR|nr:PREDICTED: signal peptide, CUB and EGF-like domain-containing protein 1 [Thamnophis sirtalis]